GSGGAGTPQPQGGTKTPTPQPTPFVPPDAYEFNNTPALATRLGQVGNVPVARTGLTLNSGGDIDYFVFRNARPGIYQIAAKGTIIRILDTAGRPLAVGLGQVAVRVFRARTPLYIQIFALGGGTVAHYSMSVSAQAAQPATQHPGAGRAIHRQ